MCEKCIYWRFTNQILKFVSDPRLFPNNVWHLFPTHVSNLYETCILLSAFKVQSQWYPFILLAKKLLWVMGKIKNKGLPFGQFWHSKCDKTFHPDLRSKFSNLAFDWSLDWRKVTNQVQSNLSVQLVQPHPERSFLLKTQLCSSSSTLLAIYSKCVLNTWNIFHS